LEEIIRDYQGWFRSPIFLGVRKGFLDDEEYSKISNFTKSIKLDWSEKLSQPEQEAISTRYGETRPSVIIGTPKEAIQELAEFLDLIEF
jgi:hypothetical protein